MMMSIYSGLAVSEGQKEERRMVNRDIVKLKHPEVIADHYIYRGRWTITIP